MRKILITFIGSMVGLSLLISTTAPAQALHTTSQPSQTPAQSVAEINKLAINSGVAHIPTSATHLKFPVSSCSVIMGSEKIMTLGQSTLSLENYTAQTINIELDTQENGCRGFSQMLEVRRIEKDYRNWQKGQTTLWFDAHIAEHILKSKEPRQFLILVDGRVSQSTNCSTALSCTLVLSDSELESIRKGRGHLLSWPDTIAIQTGQPLPTVYSANGKPTGLELFDAQTTVVFDQSIIEPVHLDTASDHHALPIRFNKAIGNISCDNAKCRLTSSQILIFHIDPTAAQIKLRYTLAPGFTYQTAGKLTQNGSLKLNLERCSVKVPNTPLLAGTTDHRFYVRIPRECSTAHIDDIEIKTRPTTEVTVRKEIETTDSTARLFEIMFERIPLGTNSLSMTLYEKNGDFRRLGNTQVPIANNYVPVQLSLKVPSVGMVSVIPSNRNANLTLRFESDKWIESVTLVDRPGFYKSEQQTNGWLITGEEGVSGNVPLKLAYRPSSVTNFASRKKQLSPLLSLVTFETDVVLPVKQINIPERLLKDGQTSFFNVYCGTGSQPKTLGPGLLERIAFNKRDSCRIVFDRDKIPLEAGAQRVHVKAGGFNEIILLEPARGLLTIAIPAGARAEYDTVSVVVSHDLLSGHYALASSQRLGEEVRYNILLSDSWVRMSVTTALPTGLFRFGAKNNQGSVPLSAGALARISLVQRDGHDFPIGLEMGPFGTDLSGSAGFSIVSGIGLSIPVLNRNTSLQASFNIHAWLEYSPTSHGSGEYPWSFLFGPSFTVGQVSTTF